MPQRSAPVDPLVGNLTIAHYLAHAERRACTGVLRLRAGALDIGMIHVDGGVAVHAELPGAAGEAALELIARLRRADVGFSTGEIAARTVARPWREFFAEPGEPTPPALAHLHRVFAAHEQPLALATVALAHTSADDVRTEFERTFRDAVAAYARRDRDGARRLFQRCVELRPDDPRARHNLDRLCPEEDE